MVYRTPSSPTCIDYKMWPRISLDLQSWHIHRNMSSLDTSWCEPRTRHCPSSKLPCWRRGQQYLLWSVLSRVGNSEFWIKVTLALKPWMHKFWGSRNKQSYLSFSFLLYHEACFGNDRMSLLKTQRLILKFLVPHDVKLSVEIKQGRDT